MSIHFLIRRFIFFVFFSKKNIYTFKEILTLGSSYTIYLQENILFFESVLFLLSVGVTP